MCWLLAVVVGVLPERLWPRLEPPLPLRRAAFFSALLTLAIGFFTGFDGFLRFGGGLADANNAWMLRHVLANATEVQNYTVTMAPYGFSFFSLFAFLLLTPLGLLCTYLVASGFVRALSAVFDDPRGDFLLSGGLWAATTLWSNNRAERRRIARERLEGDERPDVLQTGDWASVDADFVVLASRRKAEWDAGAIIMTSSDWYKLGVPFDIDTPAGLRTAYPLTKMETVEVVRRGIQYELPRLARQRETVEKAERRDR